MPYPVIDLHCDLLSYLSDHPDRTPHDPLARCSIAQLREGQVRAQVLAVFTKTEPKSIEKGMQQTHLYRKLLQEYPQDFNSFSPDQPLKSPTIGTCLAFENASGFCSETENLQDGLNRLNEIIKEIAKPLYISLTWNHANRFGGGALEPIGLKEDGRRLLQEINKKKIAIDLSHASDILAEDIINYIDKTGLKIPLMASHSNARSKEAVPRNLSDELAQEIFRRGGIVGLNLYRPFIGNSIKNLGEHLAHWIALGGENQIALGADFFYISGPIKESYFEELQDASCYGRLFETLENSLKPSDLKKLAYQNALSFMTKLLQS